MKKILKVVYILLILLIIFFLGFYFGIKVCPKTGCNTLQGQLNEKYRINLSIYFDDTYELSFNNLDIKTGDKLLDIIYKLKDSSKIDSLETKDYGDMGILLVSINSYKNGDGNRYWQYFVNGVQPMVSIDKYELKNGDNIELKFSKSEF